jgi:hypothetical protein
MQHTLRTRTSETFTEEQVNLRGVTNLEVLVKNENGGLLPDSHSILNRWKRNFSKLLNAHKASDVRQIEICTVEPLIPGPSPFEVGIAIAKLIEYKSRGSDQVPEELIQVGDKTLLSVIHKVVWNKGKLPDQWTECIGINIYKMKVEADYSYYCGMSLLSVS